MKKKSEYLLEQSMFFTFHSEIRFLLCSAMVRKSSTISSQLMHYKHSLILRFENW